MNIFNSLGSNYDLKFALIALFAQNKKSYKEKLVAFLEKKYEGRAILVYKGRQAIGLALEILNLPKKSFIAINGFTCFAVYKAIMNGGYDAQILDLPNTLDLNFSAEQLQKALKQNPRIKAVIIQNTLGYPCDIEKIAKICKEKNLILIEDLAHSIGAIYKNDKEAGTIGDFVVLSFSQDKIIDSVSGGALIIRNKKYNNIAADQFSNINNKQQFIDRMYPLLTLKIRKMYPSGFGKLIHFVLKSLNLLSKPMNETLYTKYCLPNWYCSLVLNAFDYLKKNLKHRREIVDIYNSMLDKKITSDSVNKNIAPSSNLRYPIFVEDRKSLINYLKKEGVYVFDIWYDDVSQNCPNAVKISKTVVNLPTHINVTEKDALCISNKINQWLNSQ